MLVPVPVPVPVPALVLVLLVLVLVLVPLTWSTAAVHSVDELAAYQTMAG